MIQEQRKCPICDNNVKVTTLEKTYRIECGLCGEFNIGGYLQMPSLSEDDKIKLRYYYVTLDENDDVRVQKWITKANKDDFLSNIDDPPSSLLGKIDLVLEEVHRRTKYFAQEVNFFCKDYRLFFCKDILEFYKILQYLNEQKYISINSGYDIDDLNNLNKYLNYQYSVSLTANGIKKIEESGRNPKSIKCFVAMWFNDNNPNMQKIYTETIKPAIEQDAGYEAIKIDNKEHINYITDEIIKDIRLSKFMIADLTGCRGGVYYEVGFAFGLGLPVIFTCNKKWEEQIHFDVKQRNMIFWEEDKLDEFRKALLNRIGSVIGLNK